MWGITLVLLKWRGILQDCVLLPIWWNQSMQDSVSSSSESALPAAGRHSQSQWEFPRSGFITPCLSSQAHNAEGEGWDGCLHLEEWRENSAVWGALYQLLIHTVLPVTYSEAKVEKESFAASGIRDVHYFSRVSWHTFVLLGWGFWQNFLCCTACGIWI